LAEPASGRTLRRHPSSGPVALAALGSDAPTTMADTDRLLALSDLILTHDGYPVCVPSWAVAAEVWTTVLPTLQSLRLQAGDFEPVRLPDVSAWFERTCVRCAAGFRSRVAGARYCSSRCDPRVDARATQAAGEPPSEAPTVLPMRRRPPADAAPVNCAHCRRPASAARVSGRWFCSIRCARQARAMPPGLSRDA
jgi:hypothetical protein